MNESEDNDGPVIGDVTAVFAPASAAELSMLLQHVIHTMPPQEKLNARQQEQGHWLGQAALAISAGLVQAMKDAGMSEGMIARVTGNIQAVAPDVDQLAMEVQPPGAVHHPNGTVVPGPDSPHPLDQPAEPTNDSPGVDFPAPDPNTEAAQFKPQDS